MNESNATAPNLQPLTPLDSAASAALLDPLKSGHPRNGKIALMPRDQRDRLNQMLSNGATYKSIIEHFHLLGTTLNSQNISNWKSGGYQEWLSHSDWVAEINQQSECASDLALPPGGDDASLHRGVIRLAIIQIFKALKTERLKDDAPNYTRLLNALARLSREGVFIQKYVQACAETRALLEPMKDPDRELSDEDRAAIVHQVDRVLGFVPDRPRKPAPARPPVPEQPPVLPPASPPQPLSANDCNNRTATCESASNPPVSPPAADGSPSPEVCRECQQELPSFLPTGECANPWCPNFQISVPTPLASPTESPAATDANNAAVPCESGPNSPVFPPVADASPSPELCRECQHELPPLLPTGERPDHWCPNPKCQTSLPDPLGI